MALLRKMTCNLRHPMGLRHPVQQHHTTALRKNSRKSAVYWLHLGNWVARWLLRNSIGVGMKDHTNWKTVQIIKNRYTTFNNCKNKLPASLHGPAPAPPPFLHTPPPFVAGVFSDVCVCVCVCVCVRFVCLLREAKGHQLHQLRWNFSKVSVLFNFLDTITIKRTFENFSKAKGHQLHRLGKKFSKDCSIDILWSKLSIQDFME